MEDTIETKQPTVLPMVSSDEVVGHLNQQGPAHFTPGPLAPIVGSKFGVGTLLMARSGFEQLHTLLMLQDIKTLQQPQMRGMMPCSEGEAEEMIKASIDGSIAEIVVKGMVVPEISKDEYYLNYYGMVGLNQIRYAIQAALNEPKVKSIVLRVTGPGGIETGNADFSAWLRSVRRKKPIIVHVSAYAFSASYYLISGATAIVAAQDAMVGSIGAYVELWSFLQMYLDMGIDVRVIVGKNGDKKALNHPFTPITEEGEADAQMRIDRCEALFIANVAKGRQSMSRDDVAATHAGIFRSDDAKRLGLIDDIMTIYKLRETLRA